MNRRVYATYIRSDQNVLADHLSRLKLKHFKSIVCDMMDAEPETLPKELGPLLKIWIP